MRVANTLPFGNAPIAYRGGGYTSQYQNTPRQYSPLDVNKDGKVDFKDAKQAMSNIKNKMDLDGDGDVDFQDFKKAITRKKKVCIECNKPLTKKSKYGTGVCVECYRNPPEHMICKATIASGDRCKRRISSDSKHGYCGIHIKKHEKTQ